MEYKVSRKIVLDIVKPYFFEKGFQLYSEPHLNDMFYLDNIIGQVLCGFYFKHIGWHTFFKIGISIKVVEMILNDIYEREDSIIKPPTVFDNCTVLGYEPALTPSSKRVKTEIDAKNMAYEIIEYIEKIGMPFALKYSHLPNILEEMNTLEKEGKNWNGLYGEGGILYGGLESNFVGLIISKLCNDPDFERKFQYVENKVSLKLQWLPYLEKLKERLRTIEPVYNV
jgi:hypothetical protein